MSKKNYLLFNKYNYLYIKDCYIIYELIENNSVKFSCQLDIIDTQEDNKMYFSHQLRRNTYLPLVSTMDTILFLRKLGIRV